LLDVENVSVRFGGLTALAQVSASVDQGEVVASSVRTAPARRRC
jgi:ABC-type branched-subunit amino acid transport system ATPase component